MRGDVHVQDGTWSSGFFGQVDRGGVVQRLEARDWWLLDMLFEHRALTAEQLAHLGYAPTPLDVTRRLRVLVPLRVLARFTTRPLRGKRGYRPPEAEGLRSWCLGVLGAQLAAVRHGMHVPREGTSQLRYKHLLTSQRTHHLVVANGFFAELAAHTRSQAGSDLPTWWSQRTCGRLLPGPSRLFRRHGHLVHDGRGVGFWLEYDTRTTPITKVRDHLANYRRLADATGVGNVLVWMLQPGRELHLHEHLAETRLGGLTIATAVASAGHPADRIWLPVGATERIVLGDLPDTARLDDLWSAGSHGPRRPPPRPVYDPNRQHESR